MMYNPRWPYTFTVIPEYLDENGIPVTDENGDPCEPTPPTPTPQLDENGLPLTDENGDPISEEPVEEEPQFESENQEQVVESETTEGTEPEKILVKVAIYDSNWNPRHSADGQFLTEEVSDVPWGYRTSTGGMKTSGEVIVADYKISCPMLLTNLPTGTVLSMTDSVKTFRVKVIKMTTYNWGTNLWVDNIMN